MTKYEHFKNSRRRTSADLKVVFFGHNSAAASRLPDFSEILHGKQFFSQNFPNGTHTGRGVVPLRHLRHVPPPQYCDCGPDWPLLFKVHEI